MKQVNENDIKNKKDFATVIIFTTEEKVGEKMGSDFVYSGGIEQEVVLINEKTIVSKHKKEGPGVNNAEIERPLTSVVGYLS